MAMPLVRPKIRGQKCKAGEKMPWKERAKEMYFESGMRVGEIAAYLEVSRQSVSGHIKSLPGTKLSVRGAEKRALYREGHIKTGKIRNTGNRMG